MAFRSVLLALGLTSSCLMFVGDAGAADTDLVKKGEYLARAGDCIACHTAPGGKPFAGGLMMETPVGSISTPNITPDQKTGIGTWTDDQFFRAMHEGLGQHGEYLYPAFPFPWYTNVTRDDALAIKAYLFSLAPENAPRKPLTVGFPFDVREGLLAWRSLFFKAKSFTPDPSQSEQVNRGAYLVEGLGHCGECHNHNNLLGASDWSGKLQGGQIEGWYAPNITSDGREGVGNWSEDEIATFLKTGATPGKGVALGPMMETINDSLSHLTDGDLHAMAAYLKAVAAKEKFKPTPSASDASKQVAGEQVYLTNCASCHRPDGHGVMGAIPALAGNGSVTAQGPENVMRVVLGGLDASHGLAPMPAVGQGMTDTEIADVVNYVRTAWGNTASPDAQSGLVGTLREKTKSVLAANEPACPPIGDPALSRLFETSGVNEQIKGITLVNMLQRVDAFAPKLQAGLSGQKGDDVVNALVAAYCPVVAADKSLSAADRATRLGNFGGLVYGRLRTNTALK